MFRSGGGFDLPLNSPLEALIVVVVLVGLVWLAFQFFSS